MKNKILLGFLLSLVWGVTNAQWNDYNREQAKFNIQLGDIDRAVLFYAQSVDKAKESRNAGKGVYSGLLAEYAYALALHHDFEAALMNVDRAMMLGAANSKYFAGQILTVMGHPDAAFQISGFVVGQNYNIPRYSKWIDAPARNLTEKYKTKVTINRDNPQAALKRANTLTERGQMVQAIVLYEELMEQYPEAYIIPANYSVLWEKLGNRVYAATLLKRSLKSMGTATSDTASRNALEEHLRGLEAVQPAGWSAFTKGLHTIVYTGVSINKEMTSLNGRIGISTDKKTSLSLNANIMFMDSTTFGSVGLSAYKTWSFFVVGLGVSRQLSKSSPSWGLAPSVGLTFLNKAQTASIDITAAGQFPFGNNIKPSFSLSLGTTFYLDFKNKKQ
jgi:tetratricopeptide (TPR) repeat protein